MKICLRLNSGREKYVLFYFRLRLNSGREKYVLFYFRLFSTYTKIFLIFYNLQIKFDSAFYAHGRWNLYDLIFSEVCEILKIVRSGSVSGSGKHNSLYKMLVKFRYMWYAHIWIPSYKKVKKTVFEIHLKNIKRIV